MKSTHPQKLCHAFGEAPRIEFETQLDPEVSVAPVHVLGKTSEIYGLSADPGPVGVEVSGLDGVVGECQGVQHARLSGTVGAIDQCDRS